MGDVAKQITALTRRAREVDNVMDSTHAEASGAEQYSLNELTDLYLASTFEERMSMFTGFMSEQGITGLQTVKKIMARAAKEYRG